MHRQRGPIGHGGLHARRPAQRAPGRSAPRRDGRAPTPSTASPWACAPAPRCPGCPSSPTPTSAGTAAARSMASTSCTPSWWSSWKPTTCASCGASSRTPRPRRPRSAACAATCRRRRRRWASGWPPCDLADGRARRRRGRARPGRARGRRLRRVRRRAVGVVPDARHRAVTRGCGSAQSAWTERSPAQARSAMRPASLWASSSTSASESGRCAMNRRLAPSAMPTMP